MQKRFSSCHEIALHLLVSSAGNLCKQLGPRPGATKRRAWSRSKMFDTLMTFLKDVFFLKLILKKSADDKKMQNSQVGKEIMNFLTSVTFASSLILHAFCLVLISFQR